MDIPVTDADHQQIRREMAADLADAKLEIQVYKRQLSTALQAVAQRNTLIGNLRQEVEDARNDRDQRVTVMAAVDAAGDLEPLRLTKNGRVFAVCPECKGKHKADPADFTAVAP